MRAISIVGSRMDENIKLCCKLAETFYRRGLNVVVARCSSDDMMEQNHSVGQYAHCCTCVVNLSSNMPAAAGYDQHKAVDVAQLLKADVLIVENGTDIDWAPWVIVSNPGQMVEKQLLSHQILAVWGTDIGNGVQQVEDLDQLADLVLEKGFSLPGLDCGACGREGCSGLARDIVVNRAETSDCEAMNASISATNNGKKISMNPFVASLLQATISSIFGQLKGVTSGKIVLTMNT